jgi:hypothetical protein
MDSHGTGGAFLPQETSKFNTAPRGQSINHVENNPIPLPPLLKGGWGDYQFSLMANNATKV